MFMRNRLAGKMAAEMREATCAGTQTSKAPTLSGPSVTNHYSVPEPLVPRQEDRRLGERDCSVMNHIYVCVYFLYYCILSEYKLLLVKRVKITKCLGMVIDEKLKWEGRYRSYELKSHGAYRKDKVDHSNHICSKRLSESDEPYFDHIAN